MSKVESPIGASVLSFYSGLTSELKNIVLFDLKCALKFNLQLERLYLLRVDLKVYGRVYGQS